MIDSGKFKRDVRIAAIMVDGAKSGQVSKIYGISPSRANQVLWKIIRKASFPGYDIESNESRQFYDKRHNLAEVRDNREYWTLRIINLVKSKAPDDADLFRSFLIDMGAVE